jgi:thiamine monophosphate kinase
MTRYPNYITFAWQRSDGDYEIVGTLNGETIDDSRLWNGTVSTMLMLLQVNDRDTQAYHREDVVSVLEHDGWDWEPIKMGAYA